MKFQSQEKTLQQRLFKIVVTFVRVEPSERNKFNQWISFLIYILDYVILLSLLILAKSNYQAPLENSLFYIPLSIISVLNLIFLKNQSKSLLIVKKLIWLICCFLIKPSFNNIFFAVAPLAILSCIVWALTIEKRKVHFDSRLLIKYPLIKAISL